MATIIVRLKDGNHPSGQRNRAGVLVTLEAREVEVTPEQLEAIKNDPAIAILKAREATAETGDESGANEDPNKGLAKLTKAKLIEILIQELKQEPNKDFNPDATNPALVALIIELRAKPAETGDEDGDGNDEDDKDPAGDNQ